jgi:hypothetical protein
LYGPENRKFFKHHQRLGDLLEAAGHIQEAWLAYVDEFTRTVRNPRVQEENKRRSITRIARFAQGHSELHAEASQFVRLNWEKASLKQTDLERIIAGFIMRPESGDSPYEALAPTRGALSEPGKPAKFGDVSRTEGDDPSGIATLGFAEAQKIIDQNARRFTAIHRIRDLADHIAEARGVLEAVAVKHATLPRELLSAFKGYLSAAASFSDGVSEAQADAILTELHTYLTEILRSSEPYRDLQELVLACQSSARNLETQLGQKVILRIRPPSVLGTELVRPQSTESYRTRILLDVTNP